MANYGNYAPTSDNVGKFGLGGVPTIRRLDGNTGKDYGISNESYRLQKILSDVDDKRNPYRANVGADFKHTKFSTEMSDFSDRDYYMLLNEFRAGADSQAYVLEYLASIGTLKTNLDTAYQQKRAQLIAEHFTEAEANRIASDYVNGIKQAELAILKTQYPDSVVDKARNKMWEKPSIFTGDAKKAAPAPQV